MFPSKVIFNQVLHLKPDRITDLVRSCFDEIFSPKKNLEELLAELKACMQKEINKDPKETLHLDAPYGLIPKRITLSLVDKEKINLSQVVKTKGQNLNLMADIDYQEVQMVGFFDDKYMITPVETDIWQDYAEIIYIPKESGLTIKKLQMLE